MKKLLILLAISYNCLSNNYQPFPHSKARAVSNFKSISKNSKEILLGLEILIDPEWHTYWINPGDSGSTPNFDIEIEGADFSSSDIIWPTPVRIDFPPLTSFSYKEKVFLFKKIKLKNISQDNLKVNISAEWLVCKIECVPAFGDLELSLNVGNEIPWEEKEALFYKNSLPQEKTLDSKFVTKEAHHVLEIPMLEEAELIDFFPLAKQGLDNAKASFTTNERTLSVVREVPLKEPLIQGLLIFKEKGEIKSYWSKFTRQQNSWLLFAFFAFLGGLILNAMPCVLPILSLKIFSLVKHSEKDASTIRIESLSYSIGAIFTFLLVAIALYLLRLQGQALGWGFQLQEPSFIAFMIILFTFLSMNFLGLYEFQISGIGAGDKLTKKGPVIGSFFTGLLSVLVASPCTAPFMGASMGFALSQPLSTILLIFSCLGIGFAFPFLVLALSPSLAKYFPKPGIWMQHFKTFLFFPMLLTILWLLWVFAQQKGLTATIPMILACVFLSFCLWWQSIHTKKHHKVVIILFALAGCSYMIKQSLTSYAAATTDSISNDRINWEEFSKTKVEEAITNSEAVFVDFTAAWCLSCQVNEKVTFSNEEVINFIKENKLRMFKADWTNRAAHITQELEKHGRYSVPLYLYYAPGKTNAVILPELLTPDIFLQKLKESNI